MIRRTLGCGCGVVALLVALGVGLAAQETKTLTVPDDYLTIQAAIDAAEPGDAVFIRAGTYTENLTVTKPLRLVGEGRLLVRIRAADPELSVVDLRLDAGEIEISGISVSDGEDGLAILAEVGALVTVFDILAIENDVGVSAGGAGKVRIADSLLVDNAYGVYTYAADANLARVEVSRGTVGIVIGGSGTTTIEDCLIGFARYAVDTYTVGCGWEGGAATFAGRAVGQGNRVFGTRTDLCPRYPGGRGQKGLSTRSGGR